jgi:hypothetical protein
MSEDVSTIWYYDNRYNAQAACEHCEGIIHTREVVRHAQSGRLLRQRDCCGPEQIDTWRRPHASLLRRDLGAKSCSGLQSAG